MADNLWNEIDAHGAEKSQAISDTQFADAKTAVNGLVAQMKKKPVNAKKSKQGKENQKAGVTSEKRVKIIFEAMGFFGVWKMKTGFNPYRKSSQPTPADFSACQSGTGKYALIEAKNITGDRLQHSRVKEHQRANLALWAENNALGYLAITKKVRGRYQTAVLSWPVAGFVKGTSILWEDAMGDRVNK